MKKGSLIFLFVLVAAACFGLGGSDGSTWNVVLDSRLNHGATVCGFENASFGITVGPHGETHYTADGGKSWPSSTTDVQCRFGLDILDDETAVSGGNGGVCISTDGGKIFTTLTNGRYDRVSFFSCEQGWIANKRTVRETRDGGKTWSDITMPEGYREVCAISNIGQGAGFMIGTNGVLYFTNDGGASWKKNMMKADGDVTAFVFAWSAMRFTDAKSGTIVTWYKKRDDKGWMLLATVDGGASWTSEKPNVNDYGTPFLSRDARFLTVFDAGGKRIVLIERD
jgi:photosystem II stability/assembly factor-like uncharacterized protein